MISIISGNEPYLINKKIEEIINTNLDANISKFDGNDKEFSIKDILNSLDSIGLFSEKNLVLVKDPIFLIKKIESNEIDSLIEYCKSPIYENELIFYTLDNLFNEKLKVFKDISTNAEYIKLNQLKRNDFINECIQILKNRNIKMSKDAFNILINSSNESISIFSQNLDVLSLYPEQINGDVVNGLLISNSDENVYNLINAITSKNISKSIYYAKKILSIDNNVLGLIALLASQLRFLYLVSHYSNLGYNSTKIMEECGIKSKYRVDMALKNVELLDKNNILKLLNELADLDLSIKNDSDISEDLKFELFIVSLLEK